MQVLKTVLFILFFLNMNAIYGQNIESNKWENRVLLILTDNTNSPVFKKQIIELKNHQKELKERKLIFYQIKKDGYKIGLDESIDWQKYSGFYIEYKKSKSPFEVLLIGLDGGIKKRETNLITSEALFAIIDVMPMRRSEINKKN